MKVVHINKSDRTGGAAVAAFRLVNALRGLSLEATMLVDEKLGESDFVSKFDQSPLAQIRSFSQFVLERLYFLPYERDKSVRFAFSPAKAGFDISTHPSFTEAEVVHLHWFNQGYLTLKSLEKIFRSGKKIVWTLHDMWAFTGGCHYAGDCIGFQESCGNCPLIRNANPEDLSHRVHLRKQFIAHASNLTIVTCSEWLGRIAASSSLLRNARIVSIPNAIDTMHFAPRDRKIARVKYQIPQKTKVILFGAANIDDPRKGFKYLLNALDEIVKQINSNELWLLIFGKVSPETLAKIGIGYTHIPFASQDALPELYSAADVMLLPSMQDNLPNTVMESLSCGTPVVAFDTGGVPEMIQNEETGYVVPQKDALAMADKTIKLLLNPSSGSIRQQCRAFAFTHYAPEIVAKQYLKIYQQKI